MRFLDIFLKLLYDILEGNGDFKLYYYIHGKLVEKGENYVVVDAGGIGYQLFMPLPSIERLGSLNETVTVLSYLYVKEGIMELYGFSSLEEKSMFIHLIGVSGIGCKSAQSILSVAPPEKLALAIITKDYKTLQKAQGVGAKAAQRIVLELSDKLKNADLNVELPDDTYTSDVDNRSEALSALIVLGYSDSEAKAALKQIDPTLNTEEIIKQALKKMF